VAPPAACTAIPLYDRRDKLRQVPAIDAPRQIALALGALEPALERRLPSGLPRAQLLLDRGRRAGDHADLSGSLYVNDFNKFGRTYTVRARDTRTNPEEAARAVHGNASRAWTRSSAWNSFKLRVARLQQILPPSRPTPTGELAVSGRPS
jgi:hypothetical protein